MSAPWLSMFWPEEVRFHAVRDHVNADVRVGLPGSSSKSVTQCNHSMGTAPNASCDRCEQAMNDLKGSIELVIVGHI